MATEPSIPDQEPIDYLAVAQEVDDLSPYRLSDDARVIGVALAKLLSATIDMAQSLRRIADTTALTHRQQTHFEITKSTLADWQRELDEMITERTKREEDRQYHGDRDNFGNEDDLNDSIGHVEGAIMGLGRLLEKLR